MIKIAVMLALLTTTSTALAAWKGVATDRDGVFWFLETNTGKLMMVEHVYLGNTVVSECFNLTQTGSNRYDIARGAGDWGEVLVTDTTGGRFVACTWQGDVSIAGNGPNTCRCGVMTDIKPTPQRTRPAQPPTLLQ